MNDILSLIIIFTPVVIAVLAMVAWIYSMVKRNVKLEGIFFILVWFGVIWMVIDQILISQKLI